MRRTRKKKNYSRKKKRNNIIKNSLFLWLKPTIYCILCSYVRECVCVCEAFFFFKLAAIHFDSVIFYFLSNSFLLFSSKQQVKCFTFHFLQFQFLYLSTCVYCVFDKWYLSFISINTDRSMKIWFYWPNANHPNDVLCEKKRRRKNRPWKIVLQKI